MCGRYTLLVPADDLALHFGLADVPSVVPRYNVAPTQPVLAVGLSREGKPAAKTLRWGLIPPWSAGPKPGPINARAETVASKPTFAEPFRKRRCLIPADGFFEWEQLPNRRKRPWHFRLKVGGPFAFAGLWEAWRPSSGPPLLTCALLTTAANELVQPVHGRMPVILPPPDYAAWIDRGNEDVAGLLRRFPADAMEARPVGPMVNNPRNDGPECLAPPAP